MMDFVREGIQQFLNTKDYKTRDLKENQQLFSH